jgi:hypothetical protein
VAGKLDLFGTSGCCSTNPLRFRLPRLRLLYLPPSPATTLCALQVRPLVQAMMSEYPRTGSYRGSMYEHGIDAKIVIMGNTGQSPLRFCPGHSALPRVPPASPLRCGEDQLATTVYPGQVRPQEHDVYHRSVFRHEEGLQGRAEG